MPRLSSIGLAGLAAAAVLATLQPPPARSQSTPPAATPPAAATAATPATPPAPPSPVSGIRNKLAAGDLLSAESILEVHREKNGEDAQWLAGLSWLARGALLLGDVEKAGRYAADVGRECVKRLDTLALELNHDAEGPLGTAIEVQAQLLERQRGSRVAAAFMRAEISAQKGPPAFMARLHKRLNLLELAGQPAPEIAAEGHLGDPPPTLASLRGKPVVLFVWAEWCGDCKAQEATLARVLKRHADVRAIALTRWFDADSLRARETARVDSVWSAVYADVGSIPRVFSTASMIRYGGSSTPTFVFVDRRGIVRDYTPTRLTEAEFERRIGMIVGEAPRSARTTTRRRGR